ncbi:acyl-CoA dehydrogenase domain protein [Segniliparus rotundus DSM 44985]|uniref:Acyl-CoA dehydrogenase domain protein n=1 Tax=Segniliparus rotundus (strain ATCC BAA-972 / CDC 1076 / CIP 108378 / DSM 44985 / JCM 13578) TaxID=640132 RepID=D6Z8C9_SEGRD|nr:acyl-CoA dehydrogenase family protein [Segniliparus rotundus]ADG98209.1 acyl-CoA dehydrogenase domain protein [Segniliparus rotundus DSM 44985]
MAINLELPKKYEQFLTLAHDFAGNYLRPIARKYDLNEHAYPVEMDVIGAAYDAMNETSNMGESVNTQAKDDAEETKSPDGKAANKNGANLNSVLAMAESCWGCPGLTLTIPGQGLGNSAIAAVADADQYRRFGKKWAAMAITEPGCGSDSAAIRTTATLDGDEYVINGEKIYATAGSRASHIVVWATVDKSLGRAAIKSFVVPRDTPGVNLIRVEHKLGIRASDTAALIFDNVRVPKENLLGSPEVNVEKGFAGVMQTFDNTRPVVASMAIGVARGALEDLLEILTEAGVEISYDKPPHVQHAAAAEYLRLEAEYEAAYLLTLKSAWMADNKMPNSREASMAKAKAGRMGSDVTLKAIELAGLYGYSQRALLEKYGRDTKIFDIYEGTQQIQQLIVARRTLNLTSAELK